MSILLGAIMGIVHLVISIYILVIVISAFLSFLHLDPRNPFVEIINRVTLPVFEATRRKLPWVVVYGMDLSPIIIIFVLHFMDTLIMGASISVALLGMFSSLITMYIWIVIISAVLSFVPVDPRNPIVEALNRLTLPLFRFVREKMPFVVVSGIDLSPLVIIVGLKLIDNIIMQSIIQM